jgi:hypothetical protein
MMTSPQEYQRVVLEILPDQGLWSEERYLWLTDYTFRLIEFTDGYLEVLPTPTDEHQGIPDFLNDAVNASPRSDCVCARGRFANRISCSSSIGTIPGAATAIGAAPTW